MKKVILNIPDDYADVLTITCVGGAGKSMINVYTSPYDLTKVDDVVEFDVKAGGKNDY